MMFKDIVRIDKTLRPYQQAAKSQIFAAWDDCDNVMFQMPTGTGKTRLFTSIISDLKAWSIFNNFSFRILIIAHRVELIEQISESLSKYKVPHGIIAGGKPRNLQPQVQVASIQTITHRSNVDIINSLNADYIIIDEAHHSVANSYKKLWHYFPRAKKLGVTATPWRMNHQGFKDVYDKLITSSSIKNFIEEGWLAPYKYYSVNENSSLHAAIDSIDEFDVEGDYKISALERVVDRRTILSNLLDSYNKLARGKKGIIYSVSRRHSDHICSEFRSAGINIVRIDSETPRDERRLYVQRFKAGLIDVIVNVDIFSEGFDCPDIEFVQLARPTKSLVKYLQQVGRGLRPTRGKSTCIILDNVGAYVDFSFPDSDRDWEKEFVGESVPPKKRQKSNRGQLMPSKRSFDEGCDELALMQDVAAHEVFPSGHGDFAWSDSDDSLLRTLYSERRCSIEIIATVFNRDGNMIKERIKSLGLIDSEQDAL